MQVRILHAIENLEILELNMLLNWWILHLRRRKVSSYGVSRSSCFFSLNLFPSGNQPIKIEAEEIESGCDGWSISNLIRYHYAHVVCKGRLNTDLEDVPFKLRDIGRRTTPQA